MTLLQTDSRTADINAAMRAAERHRDEAHRLVDDPIAHAFVRRWHYRALCSRPAVATAAMRAFDRVYAGMHAEIMLRNRFYEDVVKNACDAGIAQVVLLGAGYDSFAHRHDVTPARVFEVDSPCTQRAKLEAIARRCLSTRSDVVYVECDFERDAIAERLTNKGFDPVQRSVFVWLGVSYYLTDRGVRTFLAALSSISSAGTQLVWDYLDPEVVDRTTGHRGARRAAAYVARRGEPYRFGIAPAEIAALCAEAGFEVRDHVRVPELAARYAPSAGVWCRTDDYMGLVTALRCR